MKKLLSVLMLFSLVVSLVFASGSNESQAKGPSGKLVIYSPDYDEEFNMFVETFQDKYPNIEIEAVHGGAGDLKTRLKAEAANPQADVMLGGPTYSDYVKNKDLWEPYVASNNSSYPKEMQNNTEGCLTYRDVQLVCLLVNKEEAKKLGVEIKSYKDLLNPKLKGKIISADPAASSSAWNQLSTMLSAMGGYESKEAWDYVEALIQNLNGVMSSSSSAVYKNTLNGEYVVGITYEAPCVTYIEEGQGDKVEIVYPSEGINAIAGCVGIIKNCKNLENAKLFVDHCASDEVQALLASSTVRQANSNLPTTNEILTPYSQIKIVNRDEAYLSTHTDEILSKWAKLWAKYN